MTANIPADGREHAGYVTGDNRAHGQGGAMMNPPDTRITAAIKAGETEEDISLVLVAWVAEGDG